MSLIVEGLTESEFYLVECIFHLFSSINETTVVRM